MVVLLVNERAGSSLACLSITRIIVNRSCLCCCCCCCSCCCYRRPPNEGGEFKILQSCTGVLYTQGAGHHHRPPLQLLVVGRMRPPTAIANQIASELMSRSASRARRTWQCPNQSSAALRLPWRMSPVPPSAPLAASCALLPSQTVVLPALPAAVAAAAAAASCAPCRVWHATSQV